MPDFLGHRLTVRLQARDVNLDGPHGALAALLSRAADYVSSPWRLAVIARQLYAGHETGEACSLPIL